MDETLFVNAATLRIPNVYITHQIAGVPLMVFPYIGALKSWLYTPVFSVLGVSPTTLRLPAMLIVSVGLVLLYLAVRELVNRPVALLVFVALCFDNSVFWLTRDDVGPTALEIFLKCAAVYVAMRLAREPRRRWCVLLLATLGLGVFNKLNFIWMVNAASAVSLIVVVRARSFLRTQWQLAATWFVGLAVLYGGFGWYYFGNHIGTLGIRNFHGSLLGYTWPQFKRGTEGILSGTWFYDYALHPLQARTVVVWLILALFVAGAVGSVAHRKSRNWAVAAMSLCTVLLAAQTLVTAQATAGWHYISIYPFVIVVAGYGAYVIAGVFLRSQAQVRVALACLGIASLAYSGVLMAKYFKALRLEPQFSAWSPGVYELSNYLRHTDARVFTADWGIFNPLFALDPGSRYVELAFGLENAVPAVLGYTAGLLANTPGPKLVVTHARSKLAFADSRTNLFRIAGRHLHIVRTFAGADGASVYELYAYH